MTARPRQSVPQKPRDEPEASRCRAHRAEFRVYDVTWVPDAVAPTLSFALGVTETSGREVFTIALTAQINIDPARRSYDAETTAALVELFGAPERWAATTKSFVWSQVEHARAELHGRDDLHAAHAVHLRPRARGGQVPLQRARRRGAAELPLHRLGAAPRRRRAGAGRAHPVDVLGGLAHARRDVAGDDGHHYPNGGWVRLHADTRRRARGVARPGRGLPSYDACVAELLEEDG